MGRANEHDKALDWYTPPSEFCKGGAETSHSTRRGGGGGRIGRGSPPKGPPTGFATASVNCHTVIFALRVPFLQSVTSVKDQWSSVKPSNVNIPTNVKPPIFYVKKFGHIYVKINDKCKTGELYMYKSYQNGDNFFTTNVNKITTYVKSNSYKCKKHIFPYILPIFPDMFFLIFFF